MTLRPLNKMHTVKKEKESKHIKLVCTNYNILEALGSSQIKPAMVFSGRSCQNELMRSNNFGGKVPVTMCTEVEAQANNCENKASV